MLPLRMSLSSPQNEQLVASYLTAERLRSYTAAGGGDLSKALALYDWNAAISGALHEDLGRVEVVLRNAIDMALTAHGRSVGCPLSDKCTPTSWSPIRL